MKIRIEEAMINKAYDMVQSAGMSANRRDIEDLARPLRDSGIPFGVKVAIIAGAYAEMKDEDLAIEEAKQMVEASIVPFGLNAAEHREGRFQDAIALDVALLQIATGTGEYAGMDDAERNRVAEELAAEFDEAAKGSRPKAPSPAIAFPSIWTGPMAA